MTILLQARHLLTADFYIRIIILHDFLMIIKFIFFINDWKNA